MKKRKKKSEVRKVSAKNNKKESNYPYLIFLRYILLLAFMFSLPIIYKIFTPLTIYPLVFLLGLFFKNVALTGSLITINYQTFISIIPACIAGSAYLLLLILNLSVPMDYKKRISSLIFSAVFLLFLNIVRLLLLSLLYSSGSPMFDFTHKLFWYLLSTIFVVAIWLITCKVFKIKEIPVYTDISFMIRTIKKK